MKKFLLVFFLLLVLLAVGAVFGVKMLVSPVETDAVAEFSIPEGSGSSSIAAILQEQGLVKNAKVFSLYARFKEVDSQFKAGSYSFPAGEWSLEAVCEKLIIGGYSSRGEVRVTIREGLTVEETIQVLVEAGLGSRDVYYDYIRNGDFSKYSFLPDANEVVEPASRLEGFLFPNTYMIELDSTEQQIIDMLLDQFVMVWTENGFDEATKDSEYSMLEIVTMASLVEKEARVDEDRPLIAGVFYKRLEIGMLLESCATIQFLLGEPKDPLLYSDLEIVSPYNSYKNAGLPPGPIAAPGLASLKAAVYPTESEYLYFRARTDGSHRFSTTLQEHQTPHDGDY
ncbi:MAG: endolytic transglycosylase MltG [Bacillota bacterium]|nr:endolytic transglycosylase MltG [Bacillota bacterium]